MNRTMTTLQTVCLTLVLATLPTLAHADGKSTIAVEGRLTNLAGAPVTGPVDLTLGLYTGPTQGQPLWSKVWLDVPLNDGVFQVLLGADSPLATQWFSDYDGLWVGVAVDSGSELPRVPLTSVGYSIYSQDSAYAQESAFSQESAYAQNAAHAQESAFSQECAVAQESAYAKNADWAEEASSSVFAHHAASANTLLGFAPDLQCSGCVDSEEISFPFAASNSKSGAALDLQCTSCVSGQEVATRAITPEHLAAGDCAPGQLLKLSPEADAWECSDDIDTTYTASEGLLLEAGAFSVDLAAVQARVKGSCPPNEKLVAIHENGTVTCGPDSNTTYLPGEAMKMVGNAFSVNKTMVEDWVRGWSFDSAQEIFATCDPRYVRAGEADSVSSLMLQTNSVGTAEILNGSVTSADIANLSITNEDISPAAAIDYSKLAGVAPASHAHNASEVKPGTFSIGNYTVQDGTWYINAGMEPNQFVFLNGMVSMNDCPAGFKLATTNLCVSLEFKQPKNYVDAQAACYQKGAHICTYEEWSIVWKTQGNPFLDMGEGAWIGNIVRDNYALYANKNSNADKDDFDGESLRSAERSFKCCMGRGR